jgi:hypothetical protein
VSGKLHAREDIFFEKIDDHIELKTTIRMAFVQFVRPAYGKIDTTKKETPSKTPRSF